jgi:beta-glucosidase/6-phospho-beta-glucosidase/beta-galactosidase
VANVLHLRNQGMPIVGFTWYSLIDQIDWDSALREKNGHVNALGLFDLDRKIRPWAKPINSSSPTGAMCCRHKAFA